MPIWSFQKVPAELLTPVLKSWRESSDFHLKFNLDQSVAFVTQTYFLWKKVQFWKNTIKVITFSKRYSYHLVFQKGTFPLKKFSFSRPAILFVLPQDNVQRFASSYRGTLKMYLLSLWMYHYIVRSSVRISRDLFQK